MPWRTAIALVLAGILTSGAQAAQRRLGGHAGHAVARFHNRPRAGGATDLPLRGGTLEPGGRFGPYGFGHDFGPYGFGHDFGPFGYGHGP